MKKLFLSVAALMCATLMFSQNTSDVTQDGYGHDSSVDQQGYNYADVNQYYDSNVSVVRQDGDGDISSPSTQQTAYVYQDGYANDAKIVQGDGVAYGNDAAAIQYGSMNVSRQTQLGDYNTGFVYQDGYANLAVQEQTSPLFGVGNNASIWQIFSYEGEAYQRQVGDDNDAYIEQWGAYNYASQKQFGDSNDATILQDGIENRAIQEQYGNGNTAWAAQNYLTDYGDPSLSGDNLSVQTQYGDDNEAYVSQDRFEYSVFGGNLATPFYGDGSKYNEARQMQDGTGNKAWAHQSGMYNLSLQTQYGSDNSSLVQQDGYGNLADELQDGVMNTSHTYQLGDGNRSYVDQGGYGHASSVDQQGYYNTSNVLQRD